MKTTSINGIVITQHRKNIAKYVSLLIDNAQKLIKEGKPLCEISDILRDQLATNTRNTRIYISYLPIKTWNKNEYIGIRDSSQDCTLISIRRESSKEKQP